MAVDEWRWDASAVSGSAGDKRAVWPWHHYIRTLTSHYQKHQHTRTHTHLNTCTQLVDMKTPVGKHACTPPVMPDTEQCCPVWLHYSGLACKVTTAVLCAPCVCAHSCTTTLFLSTCQQYFYNWFHSVLKHSVVSIQNPPKDFLQWLLTLNSTIIVLP